MAPGLKSRCSGRAPRGTGDSSVHGESDRTSVALATEAFSRFDVAVYAMRVGIAAQHSAGTYWDSLEPMAKGEEKLNGPT